MKNNEDDSGCHLLLLTKVEGQMMIGVTCRIFVGPYLVYAIHSDCVSLRPHTLLLSNDAYWPLHYQPWSGELPALHE